MIFATLVYFSSQQVKKYIFSDDLSNHLLNLHQIGGVFTPCSHSLISISYFVYMGIPNVYIKNLTSTKYRSMEGDLEIKKKGRV